MNILICSSKRMNNGRARVNVCLLMALVVLNKEVPAVKLLIIMFSFIHLF